MPKSSKYKSVKSRPAAINTLKRFFADKPNATELTFDDIVQATNRADLSRDQNMSWLSNKWPTLKNYDFIRVEYDYDNGPMKFDRIRLLPEGEIALGRRNALNEPIKPSGPVEREVTLESVWQDVLTLRKQMPSFEVEFNVAPKEAGHQK